MKPRRFLGKEWQRPHFRLLICWFAGLIFSLFGALVALKPHNTSYNLTVLLIATGVTLLLTLAYGFYLGRKNLWKSHALHSIAIGATAIMLCYVAAMVTLGNGLAANGAAAAGFVLFFIPTAIYVAFPLSIGAGAGKLSQPHRPIKQEIAANNQQ